jgi:hypothetical protein
LPYRLHLQETIATELLKEEDMLKDNYFGRLVLRNCKIDYFKRKQDGWVEDLNANDRKRKMFSEFLEPGAEEGSAEPSEKEKKHKARSKAKADPAMAALGFGAVAASDDGKHGSSLTLLEYCVVVETIPLPTHFSFLLHLSPLCCPSLVCSLAK